MTSYLFSRFLAPAFLKIKNKALAKGYSDGYINRSTDITKKNRLFPRLILVLLLTYGLLGSILFSLDVNQFSSGEDLCSYAEHGTSPEFNFTMFLTVFGLLIPVAVGILSISWAIEDSGLVHYSFKEGDFYEIEPIHMKFGSYVKGYAGISSLIFVVQFVITVVNQQSVSDAALILVSIIMAFVCFVPAYLVYSKVVKGKEFLRKDLSEVKILSEEDLK